MSTQPIPITAYATANGMGRDLASVAASLEAGRSGLSPCPLEVPFSTVCGVVPGELAPPPPAFASRDSRTLRLALMVHEGIAAPIERARRKWGDKRVAMILGTSTGGIGMTEAAHDHLRSEGSLPAGYGMKAQHLFASFTDVLAEVTGIGGPRYVVSSACTSSGKAIASAIRMIRRGAVDAALVGGADTLCYTTVRGFHSLGVLSEGPCRPFGAERPGMNVGEGAAFLLLEREGDGPEVLGIGETSDAFHMSAPHPEGRGAIRAMRTALASAGLEPGDIDYLNAHGTGTVRNDAAEALAIAQVFGSEIPVASTKGYTGHTLGAGSACEAVLCLISLERGWIPKSAGGTPPDPALGINVVQERLDRPVRKVLSNSFAFGGNNLSLVLGSR